MNLSYESTSIAMEENPLTFPVPALPLDTFFHLTTLPNTHPLHWSFYWWSDKILNLILFSYALFAVILTHSFHMFKPIHSTTIYSFSHCNSA